MVLSVWHFGSVPFRGAGEGGKPSSKDSWTRCWARLMILNKRWGVSLSPREKSVDISDSHSERLCIGVPRMCSGLVAVHRDRIQSMVRTGNGDRAMTREARCKLSSVHSRCSGMGHA